MHGSNSPIHTSFADWNLGVEEDWHESMLEVVLGDQCSTLSDAWNGTDAGSRANLSTIDRTTGSGTRSYSATGYLKPAMTRTNLKVLTGALVEKVVLEDIEGSSAPVAAGVLCTIAGERFVVQTKREVLLCAGAINTPQILELSGIGDAEILSKAGIRSVVNSSHVGENLQDHPMTCMVYELCDNEHSWDKLGDRTILQDAMQKYASHEGGPLANGIDLLSFFPVSQVATSKEMADLRQKLDSISTSEDKRQKILAS
jgi:choline dehydrogenase-like flavoprotein